MIEIDSKSEEKERERERIMEHRSESGDERARQKVGNSEGKKARCNVCSVEECGSLRKREEKKREERKQVGRTGKRAERRKQDRKEDEPTRERTMKERTTSDKPMNPYTET